MVLPLPNAGRGNSNGHCQRLAKILVSFCHRQTLIYKAWPFQGECFFGFFQNVLPAGLSVEWRCFLFLLFS